MTLKETNNTTGNYRLITSFMMDCSEGGAGGGDSNKGGGAGQWAGRGAGMWRGFLLPLTNVAPSPLLSRDIFPATTKAPNAGWALVH
ncbi:hypothetical protein E2C01_060597 [Portunus trituberculatus]|uniref:Uncharacterized protein n=1 Tax=Portunus trituberculatus TaxID=210409 RepID=A0A5B7H9G8_PORTR|nr:hypothetical protein [Portunus trituberculatus]